MASTSLVPVSLAAGAGSDTLVFSISQDAWQGAAQYIVLVDGVQIGGTFTAGALRTSGQHDTLTLKGNWAPGTHQVAVKFLNDAYGGTAATDRNLHVDGVTYNGSAVAGASATLFSNGSASFSLTDTTAVGVKRPPAAGLLVTQSGGTTAATEGGAGDNITISLRSQPTSDVAVAITGDGDVLTASKSTTTLTFTPQNWSTAQAVAVSAVDDVLREGPETSRLTFATSSSDAGYKGLVVPPVAVGVTDNDMVGPHATAMPKGAVTIKVGDDIQAKVKAAPEGAVFWIEAGEHRMQSITPKANQQFIGEQGAILNGSRELTGFKASGNTWYVDGQTQEGLRRATGEGATGFDRPGYPDAVYLDDKPLLQVGSLNKVKPGTYYFDYSADRIYIGNNPTGHSVEAAVADAAIKGSATGVTVANLIVEKYATPVQGGAIGGLDGSLPVNWTIRNNEVRSNFGGGIKVDDGSQVQENFVHDNGQIGVGAHGKGVLYANNEISTNGFWSGINVYWEGGGSKFALTDGIVVRDNHVHHNNGIGLWTDTDNIRTIYEGNRVEHNSGAGISHEISYDAVIRNNTLVSNGAGQATDGWLWGAGIQVQNSSNVEVYGNTVNMTDGGNGIALFQQNRGTGAYGPYLTKNNHVHDNRIIDKTPAQGKIGAVADWDQAGMDSGGNLFDRNTYELPSTTDADFAWGGGWYGWNAYRSASGWDANSMISQI